MADLNQSTTADKPTNGTAPETEVKMRNGNRNRDALAQSALQKGLAALQEGDSNEEAEEIRKLDSQLDHLNDYMSKMEQRLKEHNDKMMETLKQQKEERERRRQSFHERMTQNQAEDDQFQQQMADIMNRVVTQRNRQSVYDMIKGMEVPKVNN